MRLTIILILIIIAVFIIEVFSFPLFGLTTEQFFDEYGFSTNNLLTRPWVIITSIFMHGDITHLLSNIIVLAFFGMALEEEIGWKRTLLIFMIGAFAGQLFSVFYYGPGEISIGASAGIFGLIGVGILVAPFSFGFPNPMPLGLLGIIYAVYNIAGVFSGPSDISYIAHLGGLFAGLVFGFYYKGIKKGVGIVVLLTTVLLALILTIPLIIQLLAL
ncbi:MAG: rhomboid family intramembrane serine protease [Candidatus Aenigmarchaeota archaeon]|nr:rhomboid family intramembrane serine protease [Candidatus Aenigmarchaeota archaeon]